MPSLRRTARFSLAATTLLGVAATLLAVSHGSVAQGLLALGAWWVVTALLVVILVRCSDRDPSA